MPDPELQLSDEITMMAGGIVRIISNHRSKENRMGLLDDLLGKVTGAGKTDLVNGLMEMLQNKQTGGLSGLVDNFTKSGLGDIVSSWVGTGANLPISADQIVKGLGQGQLSQLASKVGVSPQDLSSTLAKVLPDVVDKLTPQGKIPTEDLLQQGLSMLQGKLKF
jgi:uncharacterized protein YidB (DUF937 family)